MTTTQRKPLSAAHKAKISRALTKNKQKKEKKEGGFLLQSPGLEKRTRVTERSKKTGIAT
jgi:hypothetical protein